MIPRDVLLSFAVGWRTVANRPPRTTGAERGFWTSLSCPRTQSDRERKRGPFGDLGRLALDRQAIVGDLEPGVLGHLVEPVLDDGLARLFGELPSGTSTRGRRVGLEVGLTTSAEPTLAIANFE